MADTKLTDLSAITPTTDDIVYVVDAPGSSPVSKKTTVANLLATVNGVSTAAYASRPSAAKDGNLFLPNNGYVMERDTGAAWTPWGPLFPLTAPPAVSSLTWVNQESCTVSETKGGIYMYAPAAAGDHMGILVKSVTPPWTMTIGIIYSSIMVHYAQCGMVFRQSSDGKLHVFGIGGDQNSFFVQKYNGPTSWNNNYSVDAIPMQIGLFYMKIADNNTNRICSYSVDGQNFIDFYTVGRTDFMTADQAGIYVNSCNGTWPIGMAVLHWKET